jgi:hypothetical protein
VPSTQGWSSSAHGDTAAHTVPPPSTKIEPWPGLIQLPPLVPAIMGAGALANAPGNESREVMFIWYSELGGPVCSTQPVA